MASNFHSIVISFLSSGIEMHISRVLNFSSRNGKNGQFLVEKNREIEKNCTLIPVASEANFTMHTT